MKKRPRRRVQRYFLDWLAASAKRLSVPIRIVSRTDRAIEFRFPGKPDSLVGYLHSDPGYFRLEIYVVVAGECWDLLADFDCVTRHTSSGYQNDLVLPEYLRSYPDRRSLWIAESFEPFFAWCERRLQPCQSVSLHQTDCGSRWATLD